MSRLFRSLIIGCVLALHAFASHADTLWSETASDGQMVVHLYFFWSLRCPHCTAAHPEIEAIARERPWLKLHDLELTRHPENVVRYRAMARELDAQAVSVPAFLFCGEMQVGWGKEARAFIEQRLDVCHTRLLGRATTPQGGATGLPLPVQSLDLPFSAASTPPASRYPR
jgi:hypothetical protein